MHIFLYTNIHFLQAFKKENINVSHLSRKEMEFRRTFIRWISADFSHFSSHFSRTMNFVMKSQRNEEKVLGRRKAFEYLELVNIEWKMNAKPGTIFFFALNSQHNGVSPVCRTKKNI